VTPGSFRVRPCRMCTVSVQWVHRERGAGDVADVGTLYIVATPIGNREDITLRALRVLREVAVVAAEDTRHTGQLLAHYGISARYLSLHEHNERMRAAPIIARLDAGEDVALVSDAGTPTLSDPGAALVAAVAAAGHRVEPVPGASAALAAIMASGMVHGAFTFVGFLPPKRQARAAALRAYASLPHPLVLYEAPHRIAATVTDAAATLGDRACALCRELTKMHEEIVHTTLAGAEKHIRASRPRGEYVLIIAGASNEAGPVDEEAADTLLRSLIASGVSPTEAARRLAAETGQDRNVWYKRAIAVKREEEGSTRRAGG
jgi:16S rRNA (cytidine1402-2'-O)-methyltransferase